MIPVRRVHDCPTPRSATRSLTTAATRPSLSRMCALMTLVANEGTITMDEFHSIMKQHMPDDSDMSHVEDLFNTMDQDQSGRIHYLEFLAATIETSAQFREDAMLEVFDRLDSDNSGAISKSNLKELLGKDYAVRVSTDV